MILSAAVHPMYVACYQTKQWHDNMLTAAKIDSQLSK